MNEANGAELETKIEAWREEFGKVAIYRTPHGVCVFRLPKQEVLESCLDAMTRDRGSKAATLRSLAQQSVLHPPLEELKGIFKRLPGLPLSVGNRLVEISGADIEDEEKKV
jgi:hypothetical protein